MFIRNIQLLKPNKSPCFSWKLYLLMLPFTTSLGALSRSVSPTTRTENKTVVSMVLTEGGPAGPSHYWRWSEVLQWLFLERLPVRGAGRWGDLQPTPWLEVTRLESGWSLSAHDSCGQLLN